MLRINFVVNTTGLTGGIRVVYEYANRLQARGHSVTITYPYDLIGATTFSREWWRSQAKRIKYFFVHRIAWFDLHAPIKRVWQIRDRYMPEADVVIATANETADWVAKLNLSKGEKFYFIQHFESWTRDPELVKNTWRLPLKKIVIASWMKKFAEELGEKVVAVITNGVNMEEFYCHEKKFHQPPKVLMMTHSLAWKGTEDGMRALEVVRQSDREFPITLFGAYPYEKPLPPQTEFVLAPSGEALRQLYCSHDIFISPSHAEGCQLPPMEAMACCCAVVATNVGGVPDYAVAGKTASVVEPKRPQQIAEALKELIDNPAKKETIAQAGLEHIRQFTWEKATDRFEKVLQGYAE